MIEHMNSACDCRVDGHHIGSRCLSLGLWGFVPASVCYLFECAQVSVEVEGQMK